MIAFRNFALRRGDRLLLSNIDLTLHAGTRVGVIGRNGCGKTSLFGAVLGEVDADSGDIDMPSRLRIASVAQETPSLPDSALDFVLGGDQEVFDVIRAEAAAMDAEDYDAVANAAPAPGRIERLRRHRRGPANCCMAWASRPKAICVRSRISPAAGACA